MSQIYTFLHESKSLKDDIQHTDLLMTHLFEAADRPIALFDIWLTILLTQKIFSANDSRELTTVAYYQNTFANALSQAGKKVKCLHNALPFLKPDENHYFGISTSATCALR
jgi:hypothetical protein